MLVCKVSLLINQLYNISHRMSRWIDCIDIAEETPNHGPWRGLFCCFGHAHFDSTITSLLATVIKKEIPQKQWKRKTSPTWRVNIEPPKKFKAHAPNRMILARSSPNPISINHSKKTIWIFFGKRDLDVSWPKQWRLLSNHDKIIIITSILF
jgi:hypothetical protein